MKAILLTAASLTALGFALSSNPVFDEVMSGNKALVCNGKQVPTEKIRSFDGETWMFVNGYAKNCRVKGVKND